MGHWPMRRGTPVGWAGGPGGLGWGQVRPGEVVVDDVLGIAEVAFQPTACCTATLRRFLPKTWKKSFQKLCASARSEVSPSHSRAKARARSRISLRLSGTCSSPGGSQRLRRIPTAQQVEEGAVHIVV